MPTVGLEYRYPFINVQSWGTQTIKPIAQVIARPNEQQIGNVGRTRMRKASRSTTAICSVSTSSRAGTARKAADAPTPAFSTPRSSIRAASSTRCLASRTTCLARTPSRSRAWATQVSRAGWIKTSPTMSPASRSSRTAPTNSRRASASTPIRLKPSVWSSKAARSTTVGARLLRTGSTRPNLSSASSRTGTASAAATYKLNANWCVLRQHALRPGPQQARVGRHRPRLHRRLLHYRAQLPVQLFVRCGRQHRSETRRFRDAADRFAHIGRELGQPTRDAIISICRIFALVRGDRSGTLTG